MNTDAPVFFAYLLKYVLLYLYDNVGGKCEKVSNSKSSASGRCFAVA